MRLPKSRRRRSALARARARVGFAMSLPVMVLVGVFVIYPTVQAVYYSFTDWNGATASFVGLANYHTSLSSGPGVHRILFNNLVFVLSVPIAVAVEYCVAYSLWRGIRGRTLLRVLYVIPVAFSWAIVGIVFRNGLLAFAPNFLTSPNLALVAVVFAFHWTTAGANIIIMLAGLATVDRNHLEAATLDGARSWLIMVRIVAPQVIAFIDFAIITTLIFSFTSIFGLVYAFNFGGPGFATTTLRVRAVSGWLHEWAIRIGGRNGCASDDHNDICIDDPSDPDGTEVQ